MDSVLQNNKETKFNNTVADDMSSVVSYGAHNA